MDLCIDVECRGVNVGLSVGSTWKNMQLRMLIKFNKNAGEFMGNMNRFDQCNGRRANHDSLFCE